MGEKIKILIVDDHPFFRQGVRFFLNTIDDFELIGEAENGAQAMEIVAEKDVDVILMDLQMPGMDGIETTRALLDQFSDLRILIMTSYGNEEKIRQAITAGASGYCLKDAPPEELQSAIMAVAAGGTYLGKGITPAIFTAESSKPQESKPIHLAEGNDIFAELTQRESDVLEKLALGLSNKDIANELIISEKTVKTHVANILSKLNLKTRTQAALLASQYKEAKNRGDSP